MFCTVVYVYRCEATWGILASGQRIASLLTACVLADGVSVVRDITRTQNESSVNPSVSTQKNDRNKYKKIYKNVHIVLNTSS